MQIIILISVIIALFVSLIIGFVLTIILTQEFWYGRKRNAPFVPAPDTILHDLSEIITITPNSIVYDLGSGDGKILRALYEKNKIGKYVGVDRGVAQHLLALLKHSKIPNLSFRRKDFFDIQVSDATVVVLYLLSDLMDALLPKLNNELQSGTEVFSIDFQFKNIKPYEVFSFDQTRGRGKTLYKYIF